MRIKCDNCGKELEKRKKRIRPHLKHYFCDSNCFYEFRKRDRIKLVCNNCGKIIKKPKSQVKRFKTHFCSRKCMYKFRTGRKIRNGKIKRNCTWCGKPLERWPFRAKTTNHSFCSQKCQGNWNSVYNIGKVHCNWKPKIKKKCLVCEKEFRVKPSIKNRAKFCSDECRLIFFSALGRENNWKGGTSFEPYTPEFNGNLKKLIRERDNYICQYCGLTQEEHLEKYGCSLHVHHIDGNKKNSNSKNLVTLCTLCNSKMERLGVRIQFNVKELEVAL